MHTHHFTHSLVRIVTLAIIGVLTTIAVTPLLANAAAGQQTRPTVTRTDVFPDTDLAEALAWLIAGLLRLMVRLLGGPVFP